MVPSVREGELPAWGEGRVTGGCEQMAPWTEAQLWQPNGGGQTQGNSQKVLKMILAGWVLASLGCSESPEGGEGLSR